MDKKGDAPEEKDKESSEIVTSAYRHSSDNPEDNHRGFTHHYHSLKTIRVFKKLFIGLL